MSVRSLPHSEEAERGVLACILIAAPEVMPRCEEAKLTPEAFYIPAHGLLFRAMQALSSRSQPVEEVLLLDELRSRQELDAVGGLPFLAQLGNAIRTPIHAQHYIEIVREKHLLRRLITTCTGTVEECFRRQGGVQEFVEQVEQEIFRIGEDRLTDQTRPLKDGVSEAVRHVTSMLDRKTPPVGIPSGFDDLDKMTFGFQPGDMVVLAARPSMGKTSLALNFAEHAVLPRRADQKPARTIVFSLEMNFQSITLRLLCARARVDLSMLRQGLGRRAEAANAITEAASDFLRAPLLVNDASYLSMSEIRAICRRIHRRDPLQLVIIDYLQLIKGNRYADNRENEVSEISRGVKGLARELGTPVIVLSQLNRSTEKENRPPRLSDLRESGAIEQDADVVLMLSHSREAKEEDKFAPTAKVELIVAKQRNGQTGFVPLTFHKPYTRFENYTPDRQDA